MKPKSIEWQFIYPTGNFPPKKTTVLISFKKGDGSNYKTGTGEGYFGNPFIDFPGLNTDEKYKNSFEFPAFYDSKGFPVLYVYAWAYKPKSMLSNETINNV